MSRGSFGIDGRPGVKGIQGSRGIKGERGPAADWAEPGEQGLNQIVNFLIDLL